MVLNYMKVANQGHKNQVIWRRITHPNNYFPPGYLVSCLNCTVQSFSVVKFLNGILIRKLQILVKSKRLKVFHHMKKVAWHKHKWENEVA